MEPHTSAPLSLIAPLASLAVFVACGGGEPPEGEGPAAPVAAAEAQAAASTITAADLAARIGLLAADSMRGRDTPSPELDMVAAWIAAEFRRMGLESGAGDDFVQRYAIRTVAVDADASGARIGEEALLAGRDLMPAFQPRAGTWSGALAVLVGEGPLPQDLAEAVDGRHVVIAGQPTTEGPGGVTGALRDAGALAVWRVDTRDDGAWQALSGRVMGSRTVRVTADASALPIVMVRGAALRRAFTAAGLDAGSLLDATDAPLTVHSTDVSAELTLAVDVQSETSAPNVVGILPGSDPQLASEYVLYSAHMDHVGVGRPDATGDSIYNGADDDASGTATVIEVAEAMAALPRAPRRSQVFLLVSGEEKGLWGSAHYADEPTVPLDDVVANLNADMVGRNWPDTIVAIGKEHSDLGQTLERVNAAHPELGMTAIDDLWPEENFYRRSDHFNFARKGVPVLFFFNGTHEDYHRPSDEPELIDTEKAARIGQLLFYLGLEVADADARPLWDPASRADIVEEGR
jgi:hypothetical protein